MASSKFSNPNVKYVVAEDSAPVPKAMYKKLIVKFVVFFIVIAAVSAVSLYSLGFDPTASAEAIGEEGVGVVQLDGATDALCLSYKYVVDSCSDVSVAEIAATGCMYYFEATGGVCVCLDDTKTSCVVNNDCDLVETSALPTTNLADATDALCLSYEYVVDSCSDVSVEEIAATGCMYYVEATGGVCVCLDDSKTSCVVNSDCDLVETAGLSTTNLADATDALCLSYQYVVDSCSDVSTAEIAETGCMYYVEATGGICVCLDDSKTSCIVNSDCGLVDTSGLSTTNLADATDALCLSYKYVVDSCSDVSIAEIAETGCMYYVEATGGICVCLDDSKTSCIVNSDCDLADTSGLSTTDLFDATDALCLSYKYVVDSCSDVSIAEIAEIGCMYYVEATGGICRCLDDSKTSCIVNSDCDFVDTTGLSTTNLDDATDALCLSYEYVVDSCTDVSITQIEEIGCMYFVEATGGICVCSDDSKTSCMVNSDCDLVDTSELSTPNLADATDTLCLSYKYVVDSCSDVSIEEIAAIGCMYYVEETGGVCVCLDDSKTSCIVNSDCGLVDTTELSTTDLADATDALCLSYKYVVDSCTDVSIAEIAATGCMYYVEATGGICVCLDDSKTSCIVNPDCELVDTTVISTTNLADATDALCLSYKYVVQSCSDVSIAEIDAIGCMYYVEATGGICVCLDDSKTSCIVNSDCDLVDTSGLSSELSTTNLADATDALCLSYKYVVDSCSDVTIAEIAESGCMYYVEAAGGICVCKDDSKTSCVANADCDLVDTSELTTVNLDDATDALCLSYKYVVDSCLDISIAEIEAIGCMYYVEKTGGICVCLDDSKTSCIVNSDCDLVDTSLSTTQGGDAL